LKNQVQALQAELMALRGGNFNFDFGIKNVQNPSVLTNNNTNSAAVRNPFGNGQVNGQQSSPSPSSGNVTDTSSVFRSGQTSLATSPENDINKNETPNIDIPFDLFSNSAGPVNFTNNSANTSPLFNTDLFGNSPSQNNVSSIPLFGQNQSPVLDTFAQTLASLSRNQIPPSITGNFNNTIPSSTSTAPISSFTPTSGGNSFDNSGGNLFDMNDPLFNTWRDNSISSSGGEDPGFDIFDTMFSSMSPGAFNLVDSTGLTDFITDSPVQPIAPNGETITCPELWEKVKNHPQFDDIDIDQLCAEMRSKAKVCALSKSETLSLARRAVGFGAHFPLFPPYCENDSNT
jgi:AP-1-like factor